MMVIRSSELIQHIYIHVPFCLKKCDYCSFYSEELSDQQLDKYVSCLLHEIELFQSKFILKPITIYFGGGTPSLLKPDQINNILSAFERSQIKEVTLEANPLNIIKDLAWNWKKAGINRISLGVQSFLENELKLLGRLHEKQHIFSAWQLLLEAGFTNVSLDLIYGLPDQTLDDLKSSLQEALKLTPQHVSLYCLSLSNSVPLYTLKKDLPPDDVIADFYDFIRTELVASGYFHYEISNFARQGCESIHNLAYWSDRSYLGLGPSASGYIGFKNSAGRTERIRYTNPPDLDEYYQLVKQGNIINSVNILTNEDYRKEYIFLQLRKTEGLNLSEFQKLFGVDLLNLYHDQISKLLELEMIEISSGHLRLKPQAYFVSNEIFTEFF